MELPGWVFILNSKHYSPVTSGYFCFNILVSFDYALGAPIFASWTFLLGRAVILSSFSRSLSIWILIFIQTILDFALLFFKTYLQMNLSDRFPFPFFLFLSAMNYNLFFLSRELLPLRIFSMQSIPSSVLSPACCPCSTVLGIVQLCESWRLPHPFRLPSPFPSRLLLWARLRRVAVK